ncbi:RNase H family protein [Roseimaritima ulvae]|uniref:Ribonuclease HI n=1 Tax=Roseimaritima ulvae TaxID=980254 RepID=A0A5B9QQ24_9BACT|nr:RNase H family protein [Roseimaritima ulvae]QEG41074.1 Ribonuclease HI [Roseimaritima ulvae]
MVAFRHFSETDSDPHTPCSDSSRISESLVNEEPQTLSEYLLVCEAIPASDTVGSWRFSLETAAGETLLDVREKEFGDPKRLALLAIVRGLEAIEGAASVTLISTSRYVIRGLRDSLHRWRENGFMWEHFGRTVAVENADLWRRVDRALQFHQVHACLVSATKVSGHGVSAENRPAAAPRPVSGSPPADRLRRWLLSQCGTQGPKRKYGPADLALA